MTNEKTYKTTLRITTPHEYAFVEAIEEGTSDEIKQAYDVLMATFNKPQVIQELEFNKMMIEVLNSDLTEWQITTDEYKSKLTESQQAVYQAFKRFKGRLPEEIN